MFKVIVAGGRDFSNYAFLSSTLDRLLSRKSDVEIVSGMARGADQMAVRYARERNLPVSKFPARWGTFGTSAGFERNKAMARYGDACVCFWDGQSKGTAHMILTARHYQLQVRVIKYRRS
jgi:hypothetical protein